MKIAIIGAGVMGLSCGWRLARAGEEVEIFEQRTPGAGASGAALGALWPAAERGVEGALEDFHRGSLWDFERWLRELEAYCGDAIPFRRGGRIELLKANKPLRELEWEVARSNAAWPKFGGELPTMALATSEEIRARHPEIVGNAPAMICRATAQVRTAALMAALERACVGAGVVVRHETVEQLLVSGDRIEAIGMSAGKRMVDVVLVATGAWTKLLRLSGLEGRGESPPASVGPVKGQGIALRRPAGFSLDTIVKHGSIYMIPWEDEVLVGSTTEHVGFDELPTDTARESLHAGVAAFIPSLADAPVLRHWAGLRPRTQGKPHHPIMGPHPRLGNLHFCVGHFKTGIGMAPWASRFVSEGILKNTIPGALVPFLPKEEIAPP